MSKSHQPPVLIIGAGLAGLSLAAMLQKNEIPYLIFESSPSTPSKGHGVTLYPWAYLPLSKALHIAARELRSAVAVDSELGGFGAVDFTVRDIYTGGAVRNEPSILGPEAPDAVGPFRANKRAMQKFLLERIDTNKVFWCWTLKSSRNGDTSVTAEFESGEIIEGRLLVAADGLHSVSGYDLLPDTKPTIIPLTVYNGRRIMSRALFDDILGPYMCNKTVLSSYGEGFAFEININSINGTHAVISWTHSRNGDSPVDPRLQHSQPHPEIAKTIIADLARLPKLTAPFDQINRKEELAKDTLYNWMMRSSRIPLDSLSVLASRRVVLIGDAAHAMPIYKGTGGNHALIDSVELGSIICAPVEEMASLQNTDSTDIQIALIFYKNAYERWQDAIAATESKLQTMHRDAEALRASGLAGLNSKF